MKTRLSRKAQREASSLAGAFDDEIRQMASAFAKSEGAEFADVEHVKKAWRVCIVAMAAGIEEEMKPTV